MYSIGLAPAISDQSAAVITTFGKDFSDVGRGEWVAFAMPDSTVTVART